MLDVGELAVELRALSRAAEEAVDDREGDGGVDLQDGLALEGSMLTTARVVGVGMERMNSS